MKYPTNVQEEVSFYEGGPVLGTEPRFERVNILSGNANNLDEGPRRGLQRTKSIWPPPWTAPPTKNHKSPHTYKIIHNPGVQLAGHPHSVRNTVSTRLFPLLNSYSPPLKHHISSGVNYTPHLKTSGESSFELIEFWVGLFSVTYKENGLFYMGTTLTF